MTDTTYEAYMKARSNRPIALLIYSLIAYTTSKVKILHANVYLKFPSQKMTLERHDKLITLD